MSVMHRILKRESSIAYESLDLFLRKFYVQEVGSSPRVYI
jgi:hypothetical protein